MRNFILIILLLSLVACAKLEKYDYNSAQKQPTSKPIVIPQDLDQSDMSQYYQVPNNTK